MAGARRIVPWLLLASALSAWLIVEQLTPGPGNPNLAPASGDSDAPPPVAAVPIESGGGSNQETNGPSRPADHASTDRRPAAPDPIDWEQAAREFAAATNDGGDMGLRTVLAGLRQQFAGGDAFHQVDPFDPKTPSVDELVASSSINPLGISPDAEARRQLQALLVDYSARIRQQKRGQYLATQVSLGQAIQRGDYMQKPNGTDPDGIWKQAFAESQQDFTNRRDHNISELPGRDFSHNRVIVLRPDRYPDYVQAIHDLRTTEAEMQVAMRTFFLPSTRRR